MRTPTSTRSPSGSTSRSTTCSAAPAPPPRASCATTERPPPYLRPSDPTPPRGVLYPYASLPPTPPRGRLSDSRPLWHVACVRGSLCLSERRCHRTPLACAACASARRRSPHCAQISDSESNHESCKVNRDERPVSSLLLAACRLAPCRTHGERSCTREVARRSRRPRSRRAATFAAQTIGSQRVQ